MATTSKPVIGGLVLLTRVQASVVVTGLSGYLTLNEKGILVTHSRTVASPRL